MCEGTNARMYARMYGIYASLERRRGGNSSLHAHLGKGVAFATVVDSAATTPESTPLYSGVKRGKKKREREKMREKRGGGERMKKKPEDSQLSTLSDDNIIVRATYTSRLCYIKNYFRWLLRKMRINAGEIHNTRDWKKKEKKRKDLYIDHGIFFRWLCKNTMFYCKTMFRKKIAIIKFYCFF